MDLASNAIVARAPVCLYPGGLAVDPEGAQVFAANTGCDALWVIDTVSNAVRHILPLPSAIALRGLAIGPTATMVTSTSTTLPEDTGFIPPDAATSRCEDVFLKNAARLSGVIFKCHLKAADAAFRALPFDEEGCESAAKSKYNGTNAKLFASGGCPLCAQSNAPGLRAQLESALDETNGLVYCAGSVPLP